MSIENTVIEIDIAGFDDFLKITNPSIYDVPCYPAGYNESRYLAEKKRITEETLNKRGINSKRYVIKNELNDFSFSDDIGFLMGHYKHEALDHYFTVFLYIEKGSIVSYCVFSAGDGIDLLFYRVLGSKFLSLNISDGLPTNAKGERYGEILSKKNQTPLKLNIPFCLSSLVSKEGVNANHFDLLDGVVNTLDKSGIPRSSYSFGDKLESGNTINMYESDQYWVVRRLGDRGRQSVIGYFKKLEDAALVFLSDLLRLKTIDRAVLNQRAFK